MDIHNRGDYDIVNSGLQTKFQDGVKNVGPGAFKPIYEETQSVSYQNVYSWLSFIPAMRKWVQNSPRLFRNVQTQDFAVPNDLYEDTLAIPKVKFEDEQIAQYSMLATLMGRNAALLPDQIIAAIVGNGFGTTLAYDSLAWFSASHTIGLSTINNLRTGALTPANYGEAKSALKGFRVQPDKDSPAIPVNTTPKLVLMVPTTLENVGVAILENEFNNYGASNQYYESAELVVNPWLDQYSTTAWFLFNVGASLMPVLYQKRKDPEMVALTPFNSDRAFSYNELIWGVEARGAGLPTFPFLAIGSIGVA